MAAPSWYNVANYGTGNNIAAINSAIAAAGTAGGVITIPPGTYAAGGGHAN